jgi:plasmid replication initiation protein
MNKITITDDGKVIQTKEIDGQVYFREQERELARVDDQIARLQEIRLQIVERLKKKPALEAVVERIEEEKQAKIDQEKKGAEEKEETVTEKPLEKEEQETGEDIDVTTKEVEEVKEEGVK